MEVSSASVHSICKDALIPDCAIFKTVGIDNDEAQEYIHSISVVIPVYQGEISITSVVESILPYSKATLTPDGNSFRVAEIVLVHDCGPDNSAGVMRDLAEKYSEITCVWLSRNFGQHAATLAGMASSQEEWIVTLDEDGQHHPNDIPGLLDAALSQDLDLVYGKPINPPPHSFFRNFASKFAKKILTAVSGNAQAPNFQSYRLLLGSTGRTVAAYAGSGVYLDIALGWVTSSIGTAPITLHEGFSRPSGYSLSRLIAHFNRMLLSSGTKGLRGVTVTGILFGLVGLLMALSILVIRLTSSTVPEGWASLMVVTLISSGVILIALGVVAEYVGISVNMAMGKPPYVLVNDRKSGPHGRYGKPQSSSQ